MSIRKATIEDVLPLSILFDGYCMFYKKESNRSECEQFLNERLTEKDSVIFVAQDDYEKLVGFTQLYPLFSSTRRIRTWLLNDLFVDPEYRGQGISKKLILRAQQFASDTGAPTLYLETGKNNKIGNALYPTMGFKLDREYNHYYWDVD